MTTQLVNKNKQSFSANKGLLKAFRRYNKRYLAVGKKVNVKKLLPDDLYSPMRLELEKQGIKKAQQYILELSEKRTKITPALVCNVHREGFGFIFPDWAGKLRTEDVTVGEDEQP